MKHFAAPRAVHLAGLVALTVLITYCGTQSPEVAPPSRSSVSQIRIRPMLASTASLARESLGQQEPANREQYAEIDENPFVAVSANPRSTFSVDVDRASYANVRRFVSQGQAPPR